MGRGLGWWCGVGVGGGGCSAENVRNIVYNVSVYAVSCSKHLCSRGTFFRIYIY